MRTIRTAHISSSWSLLVVVLILAGLIGWSLRHVAEVISPFPLSLTSLDLIWFVTFLSIAWTSCLALLERPKRTKRSENAELYGLNVAVLIPAYNEDPELLRSCLQSMYDQTRRPQTIVVVNDGSTVDYTNITKWLVELPDFKAIKVIWQRTPNGGKRHAQAVGIRLTPEADVYVTVDSDTVLDPQAIAEGLKPFASDKVASVAGVCLPINASENLLTRFTGLWETTWQLVDRSSQSTLGCVTVNTGQLAFYRGWVIRHYLDAYLSETFFGHEVKYSDDSLMTLYSMMHGKTIQQPTSLCFSAVPNKYSHHIRRYIRWMRGSFIRTWWRFKYLPMTRYIYWLHLFKWVQFGLSSVAAVYVTISGLLWHPAVLPYLILMPVAISYLHSLRYLTISRNDEAARERLVTFLTAPIAMLWLLTVLRVVKWYAYATCFNTGWGTRAKVEIGLTS